MNSPSPQTAFDPMPARPRRVLEPMERILEVLCGLIMVLTFTLAAPVSKGEEVRSMLIAALGCNLAWGIVDAVMYLMAHLNDRRKAFRALTAMREAADPIAAHRILAGVVPPSLAAVLQPGDVESIQRRLRQLPAPEAKHFARGVWRCAGGVFLLVFFSTLPVVLPFVFMTDLVRARRISNLVAVAMLFITGYAYGRSVRYRPWLVGLSMVLFGSLLVGITVVLGG